MFRLCCGQEGLEKIQIICKFKVLQLCEIWDSYGGKDVAYGLGCDAVWSYIWLQAFYRNMSLALHTKEGSMFLQNIDIQLKYSYVWPLDDSSSVT